MKTKKLGVSARFGPRYGKKIRDNWKSAVEKQKASYVCPRCGKKKVKRIGYALWECQACGYRFAGGAYTPTTDLGRASERVINAKITGKEAMVVIEEAEKETEEPATQEGSE